MGLLVLTVLAVLASGCSTIPNTSEPQVIPQSAVPTQNNAAPGPPQGLNQDDFIRHFFDAGANPSNGYAAAAAYLTKRAAAQWKPNKSITIIADYPRIAPAVDPDHDPNTAQWMVSGQVLGTLQGGSFQPAAQNFSMEITLRRQSNGYRIETPGAGVTLTQSKFLSAYQSRPVYFLDGTIGIPVPDPRYILRGAPIDEDKQLITDLLGGPSPALANAVYTALPSETTVKAISSTNSGITVNLSSLDSLSTQVRKQVVLQVVKTLQPAPGAVSVLTNSTPLVPHKAAWLPSDLSELTPQVHSAAGTAGNGKDITPLVTTGGKITNLNGKPIGGPNGLGECNYRSAALSFDESELAAVCPAAKGFQLRIGGLEKKGTKVGPVEPSMSRPTWRIAAGSSGDGGYELWTVVRGTT
ncbi:MAG: LpqB family beta-propeller domain-containing protein, partial [Sciscionella sp.]